MTGRAAGQPPTKGAGGRCQPTRPDDLLTMLLVVYWRGGVDQCEAAKLLGIRKEDFAELAELRRGLLIYDLVVWRYFMRAFNERFPECDRRCSYRAEPDPRNYSGRMYTDAELLAVPQSGTENEARRVKWEVGNSDRPPASNPRELPRDIGQQLTLWAA